MQQLVQQSNKNTVMGEKMIPNEEKNHSIKMNIELTQM